MTRLRIAFITLAIALIAVPAAIVGITNTGWEGLTARIFISLSISCLIGATLIGINKNSKAKMYAKIGVSIGLLIVLLSQWL